MANLLHSFSSIDQKVITEVSLRAIESDLESTEPHEVVENPESWNPPAPHATDVYKIPLSFVFKRKYFLKEVEVTIKISGPAVQTVALNLFSGDEIKKFRQYVKD